MFCPNCGTQIPEGSKFCTECGQKVMAAAPAPEPTPVQESYTAPEPEPTPVQGSYSAPEPEPTPVQESYSAPTQGNYTAPEPTPVQGSYSAPTQGSYTSPEPTPVQGSYSAPTQGSYTAPESTPVQGSYSAPTQGSYTAPESTPVQGSYSAPTQDSYTAPEPTPVQGSYSAPTQGSYSAPAQSGAAAQTQGSYSAPTQNSYTAPTQNSYTAPTQSGAAPQPKEKKPGNKKPLIFILIGVALIAVLAVVLVMILGKDSGPDVTGKYICIAERYSESDPYEEPYEESWIELKKGGEGIYYSSFEFDLEWKLDGEEFTGSISFLGMEQSLEGTLKDNLLEVKFGDMYMKLVKEGTDMPETSAAKETTTAEETSEEETTTAPETTAAETTTAAPETTAAVVETTGAVIPALPTGDASWWSGDWYGWWVIWTGEGAYEEWEDSFWDACARIEMTDDGTAFVRIWDENGDLENPICTMDATIGAGTTDKGCLMSEDGYFYDAEIGHADWIVDPGASIMMDYDQTLCIYGDYVDPENSADSFGYYIILRPWGMEWEDIRAIGPDAGLLYDDMMPGRYDDWYLPLIQSGAAYAPDSFN